MRKKLLGLSHINCGMGWLLVYLREASPLELACGVEKSPRTPSTDIRAKVQPINLSSTIHQRNELSLL